MAFLSRIVLKECKLGTYDAVYRPSSSFSARKLQTYLDVRDGFPVAKNGRCCTIRNRPWSPIVALTPPSLIVQASRNSQVVCKAATNVSGDFPSGTPSGMRPYERVIETLTTLFPVWVILGTIIGIYKPAAVTWLQTDLFTLGLGFLMLSMGLTLTFEDFRRCMRNPWTVGVGFLAQYLIKPMLGFVIALPYVLKTQGAQLVLPVAILHIAAFALGYWISKISFGESTSRTISIECGMQSSALGFLLAQKHFTNPLVAVPSAVSVVCMALGGSGLAVFWRNNPIPIDDKDDFKE